MNTYNKKLLFLISLLLVLSSCIANNKIQVIISAKKKAGILNVTVSNIEIRNHQIIITGTNLSKVNDFKIQSNGTSTQLQIESNNNSSIVANTLSNVTFAAGKVFDFILSSANASASFNVNFSLCDSTLGGQGFNCSISPQDKEVLSFDLTSGKWRPRAVNGLSYKGTWNSNSALPSLTGLIPGDYFIVSVANTSPVYLVGDWIVLNDNGSTFDRIINSTPSIVTVFGRVGAITGAKNDYSLTKMSDVDLLSATPSSGDVLKFDGTNWVPGIISGGGGGTISNVTSTAPLVVTNGTTAPVISMPAATTLANGYLTSADWNMFSGKQSSITASGSGALDYYGGDKTFHTLNTTAVVEGTNLYFTNAKALGAVLNGFDNTLVGSITSADTVVQAFGRTQKQINNLSGGSSNFLIKNSSDTISGTISLTNVITASSTGDIIVRDPPFGLTSAVSKTYADGKLDKTTGGNLSGALQMSAQNEIRFADNDSSNYVGLKAPATIAANLTWTLPAADGSTGQVLTTDGAGILSWSSSAGSGLPAAGGAAAAPAYAFSGDTNTGMYSAGVDQIGLATAGVERVHINANGSVGIGSTTLDAFGGILAKGDYLTGPLLTEVGVGTKLIWYPKKASFRAGMT
ncbi:MAG: hypothetical protein Q7U04_13395, partial [Bacteriovorax sp.]|nr:hypothetical protein [Bacteriovorax sp.]